MYTDTRKTIYKENSSEAHILVIRVGVSVPDPPHVPVWDDNSMLMAQVPVLPRHKQLASSILNVAAVRLVGIQPRGAGGGVAIM